MLTDEISTYVVIKEEHCDPGRNLKPNTKPAEEMSTKDIFIEIKIEPLEKGDEEKEVGLYEDHEIKEEVAVGPVVLQMPVPAPNIIEHVRDATKSNAGSPDQEFSCEICKKTFSNLSNLSEHKRTHGMKFSCYLCSEKTQSKSSYEKHMLEHSLTKKLSCTICKKNYLYKKNLMWHLINRHAIVNNLCCTICKDIKFTHTETLESHMLTHSEETFSCDLCKENYYRKSDLTIHLRKHTGGKSFSCKFCTKEFETQNGLVCHERTHTGEKPFTCEICAASFARGSKLHRHLRQHSGEKRLKCKYCEKTFVRDVDLQRHVKSH